MRRISTLVSISLLAVSCRRDAPSAPPVTAVPAASPAFPAVAPTPPAPFATPRACAHRRPFGEPGPLSLPDPYASFSACDVLAAMFSDYDSASEKAASAGGTVRIDQAKLWDTGGRKLLAVTFYRGEDAELEFICGQCRVLPRVAVVERRDERLVLIGQRLDLWHPAPDITALFDGRALFDLAQYRLAEGDELLGVRVPWSTGMPGVWIELALMRLNGDTVSVVFEQQVRWAASGMGVEDDDEVVSEVSLAPRAVGPSDLLLTTSELRCRPEFSGPQPTAKCKPAQNLGRQRWRFDGNAFGRVEGKDAPLPKVLKKLWGW